MRIGKVIGTVVATRKDPRLTGNKLMLIQPLDVNQKPIGDVIIGVDTVGAGVDETIIFTKGTAARLGANKPEAPIDVAIVGIVDSIDLV
ncbi:MAG: EutN/CcmL family microcompartment protein [Clostridiales bacterium]|nr:EutN/CcmL family microcompartment protein [Clostridiales bacterium]